MSETGAVSAGLDVSYIEALGWATGKHLREGRTVVTAYEPGNFTRYELVFVPLSGTYYRGSLAVVDLVGSRPSEPLSPLAFQGAKSREEWVAVAWVEHGCYPFHLLGPPRTLDPGYIAEKLDRDPRLVADGVALLALFEAIQQGDQTPTHEQGGTPA
jgi:hypothetical protein